MNAARSLRQARRRAGLTQRDLTQRTRVAQSTIARIESGQEMPRVDTLERLLQACGESIEVVAASGIGVDRSGIRDVLARTPAERIASLTDEASTLERLSKARARR
jgi:transcriptional regulator with XRE-family HTH domain